MLRLHIVAYSQFHTPRRSLAFDRCSTKFRVVIMAYGNEMSQETGCTNPVVNVQLELLPLRKLIIIITCVIKLLMDCSYHPLIIKVFLGNT